MKEFALALNLISGAITIVLVDLIDADFYRLGAINYIMMVLFINAAVSFVLASRYKEK